MAYATPNHLFIPADVNASQPNVGHGNLETSGSPTGDCHQILMDQRLAMSPLVVYSSQSPASFWNSYAVHEHGVENTDGPSM